WLTLWDEMLDAQIDADVLLALAIRAVVREDNELNRQRLLTDIERLFWIYIEPEKRAVTGAGLEQALGIALAAASSPGAKGSVFATLRTIASGADTIRWLHDLWTGSA